MERLSILVLLSFLLVCPRLLPAQITAFDGTLSDYLALDEEGVTIGDAVFSNFQILQLQEGASGFPLDIINVVPLFDDFDAPGFRFDIMDGATAEDFFELRFTFDVHGAIFDEVSLSIFDVDILSSSNAGADVLIDLSVTGESAGGLGNLFVFAGPDGIGDLSAIETFAPTDRLTVEFDGVIDGGGEGRPGEVIASIDSATLRIGIAEPQPVVPVVIRKIGQVDENTLYIEFISAPLTAHVITSSSALVDGFSLIGLTLSSGDAVTDAEGFERVEFDISSFGDSHFFRVQTSS